MAELWTLLTENPPNFWGGGGIWRIMVNINDALTAIAYGLLVLFFAAGIIKNVWQFYRSEKAGTCAKSIYPVCTCSGAITYGMELMLELFFHCAGNRDNRNEWLQYGWKRDGTASGSYVDKIESVRCWNPFRYGLLHCLAVC